MIRFIGPVILLALGGAPAFGDEVFSAREFLYTRVFKMGPGLFYQRPPFALSPQGIYLGGTFYSPPTGGLGPPEFQGVIRKYDAMGNEIWTRQIPARDVFPSLMAADAASLYVAGTIGFGGGPTKSDFFVDKYDEAGNAVWSRRARISQGGNHVVTGLAVDASGVYVAVWDGFSQGVLRKYSPAGDELWSRTLTVFVVGGVAVDTSGVFVAVWDGPTSGFVRKYTPAGDELWIRQVDTGVVCACDATQAALAADATGIYVASGVVSKLDLSGNTMWKRQFSPAADGMNRVATLETKAAALDSTSLYVAGGTQRALPGQCKAGYGDVFVRKYNIADGTEQWTRQFGTRGYDLLGGIAVDASGVYVGGEISGGPAAGNIFLAKLGKTPAPVVSGRPQISQECVVNAASYAGGGVAPGEIVTVFGQAMGPAELTPLRLGNDGRLATTLSDTRVLFNGNAAPLIYVSATQSSAIVPYAVAEKSTVAVEIEYQGVRSDPLTLPVAPSRPGVFTVDGSGYGQGAVLNEDGSDNSAANPAVRGSIIVLYMTGEGLTNPASADGVIIGGTILKPRLPVSVWFEAPDGDGDSAEVLYAGAVEGSVAGLLQVNVRVPTWARSGTAVPFGVQIGAESAETGFTVALR